MNEVTKYKRQRAEDDLEFLFNRSASVLGEKGISYESLSTTGGGAWDSARIYAAHSTMLTWRHRLEMKRFANVDKVFRSLSEESRVYAAAAFATKPWSPAVRLLFASSNKRFCVASLAMLAPESLELYAQIVRAEYTAMIRTAEKNGMKPPFPPPPDPRPSSALELAAFIERVASNAKSAKLLRPIAAAAWRLFDKALDEYALKEEAYRKESRSEKGADIIPLFGGGRGSA